MASKQPEWTNEELRLLKQIRDETANANKPEPQIALPRWALYIALLPIAVAAVFIFGLVVGLIPTGTAIGWLCAAILLYPLFAMLYGIILSIAAIANRFAR